MAALCYPPREKKSSQYDGGHQEGSLEEVAEFLEVGKIGSKEEGDPRGLHAKLQNTLLTETQRHRRERAPPVGGGTLSTHPSSPRQ